MAKTLLKTGITTGNTVEAWHVTQSIDAFSSLEEYNIYLSGSLNITGSLTIDGLETTPQDDLLTFNTSTNKIFSTSSIGFLQPLSESFATSITNLSSSISPDTNFANTDLTFTGNRAHNINGNEYYITTDNGGFLQSHQ